MEAAGKSYPVSREIEQALALIRRGCDELLIEAELAQSIVEWLRLHPIGNHA